MTRLSDALHMLGLAAEVELEGRWVKIDGDQGAVFVIEAAWGNGFYVWCAIPEERGVERYTSAIEAIQAGLRRASRSPTPPSGSGGSFSSPT